MYHWATVEHCAACCFDLQRREGGREGGEGWTDGWTDVRREKQKHTACLGIVSGHWFRSLAADALCQVVEMQCEMLLRYWDRRVHRHTQILSLSLCVYDSLFFSLFPHIHLCIQTLCSKFKLFLTLSLLFSLSSPACWWNLHVQLFTDKITRQRVERDLTMQQCSCCLFSNPSHMLPHCTVANMANRIRNIYFNAKIVQRKSFILIWHGRKMQGLTFKK